MQPEPQLPNVSDEELDWPELPEDARRRAARSSAPAMNVDHDEKKILLLKKDLFNIRFKKVNNQINNPAQYSQIKKSIARLYTNLKNSK